MKLKNVLVSTLLLQIVLSPIASKAFIIEIKTQYSFWKVLGISLIWLNKRCDRYSLLTHERQLPTIIRYACISFLFYSGSYWGKIEHKALQSGLSTPVFWSAANVKKSWSWEPRLQKRSYCHSDERTRKWLQGYWSKSAPISGGTVSRKSRNF